MKLNSTVLYIRIVRITFEIRYDFTLVAQNELEF
jgi:hypothetical protein